MKHSIFLKGLLLTLFLNSFYGISQERSSGNFEIETDPFAYILNGYSLHAAYVNSNYRFSLGIFGLQQPEFALDNKSFSVFSSGYDFKTDYLFTGNKGVFIGIQATYGKDKLSLENSPVEKSVWGATMGLRTGYRFMFGKETNSYKGFYIVPWMMLSYSLNAQTIEIEGETFNQAKWIPFPTIHLGWRF